MAPILEVTQMTKRFGGITAVDSCSFTVEQGSVAGLIGPNGSGKTTLFNLITGFVRPDSGKVSFAGYETARPDPVALYRRGLSRTFQSARVFPRLTCLQNLAAAVPVEKRQLWKRDVISADEQQAHSILERFGLADQLQRLAGELSYGQQRLVELGMLLMRKPLLVLLDEPAAGINPVVVEAIEGWVQMLRQENVTCLIIEHDMRFVMNVCDSVMVLDHGTLIATGTPQEIQQDDRVLDAYLGD